MIRPLNLLGLGLASLLLQAGERPVYIRHARIHTLEGRTVEKGSLLLRDGRIIGLGTDLPIPEGAEVVEAEGLDAYPGFFDAASNLGLVEVPSVRATTDSAEVEPISPQLVAATAVHPESELIPVARMNGITQVLALPEGGLLPGQASVIQLDGRTIEALVLRSPAGLVLRWPQVNTRHRPFSEAQEEQDRQIRLLRDLFERAQRHRRAGKASGTDLKLEALAPYLAGEAPVLVAAERVRELRQALDFAQAFGLRLVLVGATEALRVKDRLKAQKVGIILGPCLRFPADEDAPADHHHRLAGELTAAGLTVAFGSLGEASDVRSLPYDGPGNAVAYGLSREEALRSVTRNPAELLGLGDRLGTLAVGKVANLFLVKGDPLDFSGDVKAVFIQGRRVPTENRHQRLYERFKGVR